jgi:hypothetical protein
VKESKLRELIRHILQKEVSGTSGSTGYEGPVKSDEEDEIEEVTTTGDVDGYNTPNAFRSSNGRKKKKAGFAKGHKKPNVFGYSVVKEELDKKDIEEIKKLIRDVIGDVYRDIWLKRNAWK